MPQQVEEDIKVTKAIESKTKAKKGKKTKTKTKTTKTKTKTKTKKTKSKAKAKAKGKAKKASKADQKRLGVIARAFAYGSANNLIDLERSTRVMSAATLPELCQVFRSLMSGENIKATTEGRHAAKWAAGPDSLSDKDAHMMFNGLARGGDTINLMHFMQMCIKNVVLEAVVREKTPKQLEEEKRAIEYAELDWTDYDAIISTWPAHIQEQIALARAKRVTKEVNIEDFTLNVPLSTDYLICDADLKILPRQKIALIGKGGSGKSTLFRAMANQEIKGFPTHLEVHHMKEIEVSPDAENLLDTVVHSHTFLMALRRSRTELLNRLNALEGHPEPSDENAAALQTNLARVERKLRENRNEFAEEDAAKSLRVLGFDDIAQTKSINSLSGGLRMRVALCAAFFVSADILLLDEPTNHLDFPSLLWLENKLRSYKNSLVMVCHDREILNNTCTSVMEITEELGLKYYAMGYDAFVKVRDKAEKQMEKDVDRFLARNRNVDFSSPLAVQVRKKRQWLERYAAKMALRAGQFTFPPPREMKVDNEQIGTSPEQSDISVIKVTDVRFSYDPVSLPFIFDNPINIDIKMGTRMGVMGPNGAGKSTFLKLLTQRLHPVDGTITTNRHATIGYFSQHHSAEMDLNTTPMEFMMKVFPEEKVGQLRAHLGKVGIVGGLTDTRMHDISQGLRSCVLFAKITYICPSLLIMDEPTNFLDIETVDALISATNKYRGALLLVSHSRLFLKKCATSYLSIVPGQFNVYPELEECERATYTFIAEMEEGGKVRIGSNNLAKHGSNAGSGSASEAVAQNTDGIIVV